VSDERIAVLTKDLEGRRVSIALANGSRIDDCELVSVGCRGDGRLWLWSNGVDTFVSPADIADLWETQRGTSR
jgi:hypothetical protein